jgi:hypothetical protein
MVPDSASGNAFASNAHGTLTVIHQDTPDQYHVVDTVQIPSGARNMGLDPTNHRVYVVSSKFGPIPASGKGRPQVLPIFRIDDDRARPHSALVIDHVCQGGDPVS